MNVTVGRGIKETHAVPFWGVRRAGPRREPGSNERVFFMKSTLLHAGWLAVAVAAFAAGRFAPRPGAPLSADSGATAGRTLTAPPKASGEPEAAGRIKEKTAADLAADWLKRYLAPDGTISPEKMALAVQDAVRESDPIKAMSNFTQLVHALTPGNAAAAFKAVRENVSGFEIMRYMPMLTYAWGGIDGPNAMKAMSEAGGRESMLGSAASLAGWAANDPTAAKKWLTENGTAETKWFLNRGFMSGLVRSDFQGASDYLAGLPENERGGLIDVLAEQKLKSGLDDATAWAFSLTDEKMKANALDRVAQQYARQDIAQAAEWAKAHAGEAGSKDAVGTIAREYAQKDAKSAFTWAGTLSGEAQSEAYSRVFREWARNDPTTASEQLNGMASGPAKDSSIASFTRSIARENPDDAITWAGSISSPEAREAAQVEIVQRWRMADGAAAQTWAASNLSAEALQKSQQPVRGDWGGGGGGGPFGGGGPPIPFFGGGGRGGR